VIEKALSVEQPVCILVVFRVFAVKEEYKQRVLGYGIWRAGDAWADDCGWRGIGRTLQLDTVRIRRVHRICRTAYVDCTESEGHPEIIFWCAISAKHLRLTKEYRGEKFFSRENGQLFATPLFLVLLVVEVSDVHVCGGFDSGGLRNHPQCIIVYSSNVFCDFGIAGVVLLAASVLERLST